MFVAITKATEDGAIIPQKQLVYEYDLIWGHPFKAEKIPGQPRDAYGKVIHTYVPCAGKLFLTACI